MFDLQIYIYCYYIVFYMDQYTINILYLFCNYTAWVLWIGSVLQFLFWYFRHFQMCKQPRIICFLTFVFYVYCLNSWCKILFKTSILQVVDHTRCLRCLELKTCGLKYAKSHIRLLFWNVLLYIKNYCKTPKLMAAGQRNHCQRLNWTR